MMNHADQVLVDYLTTAQPGTLSFAVQVRKATERIEALSMDLTEIANAVDGWPDHPWIAGATFAEHDGRLRKLLALHRTRPAKGQFIPIDMPGRLDT